MYQNLNEDSVVEEAAEEFEKEEKSATRQPTLIEQFVSGELGGSCYSE